MTIFDALCHVNWGCKFRVPKTCHNVVQKDNFTDDISVLFHVWILNYDCNNLHICYKKNSAFQMTCFKTDLIPDVIVRALEW